MKKELARDLLELLDSPQKVKTLEEFAEQEIQRCYVALEGHNDIMSVARSQGAISALKQLKKLRDTAVQVVEAEFGKARNSTTGSR